MGVREMQTTETQLGLLRERGKQGLPLKRVYRQLYNTNLYLSPEGLKRGRIGHFILTRL